jgi:hypothetical protein
VSLPFIPAVVTMSGFGGQPQLSFYAPALAGRLTFRQNFARAAELASCPETCPLITMALCLGVPAVGWWGHGDACLRWEIRPSTSSTPTGSALEILLDQRCGGFDDWHPLLHPHPLRYFLQNDFIGREHAIPSWL